METIPKVHSVFLCCHLCHLDIGDLQFQSLDFSPPLERTFPKWQGFLSRSFTAISIASKTMPCTYKCPMIIFWRKEGRKGPMNFTQQSLRPKKKKKKKKNLKKKSPIQTKRVTKKGLEVFKSTDSEHLLCT